MYNTVNKKCNQFALESEDHLKDTIMLVSLSIQQSWDSIGVQLRDYRKNGNRSKFLWGMKKTTALYLDKHISTIYRNTLSALLLSEDKRDIELMEIFSRIDGIGLAKAGFIVTLIAGSVGCLDTHNITRLNLKASVFFVSTKATDKLRTKKIKLYIATCAKYGSEWLWDSWCQFIAIKYPERWTDTSHVSYVHFEYLVEQKTNLNPKWKVI